MDLLGWGTGPRHCSQSVWSKPVERYYGRAALVCHYCMGFPVTNGRSKIIVCVWVRAHHGEIVAGVIRVQKMDLVVGNIPGNDLFHGSCCRRRKVMQSAKLEGGG